MALVKVLNENWLQVSDPYTVLQIPSIESISVNSAGDKHYLMVRTISGKDHSFLMDDGFIPDKFGGLIKKYFT